MRILITRSSENQIIGGAELSARDQALVLKKLGHTSLVLSNNLRIRRELEKAGIQTYNGTYLQRFKPPIRYAYFWLLFPFKIIYDAILALVLRPDVINPHTREDQISLTLTKWLHRRPVVWKDPGDMIFVFSQQHGTLGRFYSSLYRHAARRADHIYMLSEEHARTLANILDIDPKKLSAIPSSILYEHYRPVGKPAGTVVTFGSICRLAPAKNVSLLIKAFKEVLDKYPNSRLVIAGAGAEMSELQKLADNNPSITFTGEYSDVSPILNQLDIVVHPALEEGWGRVIKEAMYFGKAVIGSNVGGIKQQIVSGESGLLFTSDNKDELVSLMSRLAEDADYRNKLGMAARKKALNDGDFSRIVERDILPLYAKCIG